MIEFLDSLYVPNVGAYKPGDRGDLGEKLEAQLVLAGKAKPVVEPADVIVPPPRQLFEPSLTDD